MKSKILSIILIILFHTSYSQNTDIDFVTEKVDSISMLLTQISKSADDSEKRQKSRDIQQLFNQALSKKESFTYAFDIKFLSVLESDDKLVRIYNWNIALNDGTFEYYGFIQYLTNKKKKLAFIALTDKSAEITSPETSSLTCDNWFGALYYHIITTKDKNKTYYTLLGWDGNNSFTNKKLIEILSFNSSGKPEFGAAIFRVESGRIKRVIYEYSKQANMSLQYDTRYKMIVFDHLSPSDPKLKGQFQYYGPDFSYDGLEFEKGKWVYVPDIDARSPKEKGNKRKLEFGY